MRRLSRVESAIRKNFIFYIFLRRLAPFICKFIDLEEGFSFSRKIRPVADRYCILDIGSNDGTSINMFRRYFPSTKIIAVDPIQTPRFKLKNITLIKIALSDKVGSRSLVTPTVNGKQLTQYSSFYKEKMISQICADMNLDESEVSTIVNEVNFNTVDNLGFAPFFIKIDVEGAELEVLRGALTVIKSFNPVILVEIQNRGTHLEVQKLLSNFGYINIDPDKTNLDPGAATYSYKPFEFKVKTNNYVWINPNTSISWQLSKGS